MDLNLIKRFYEHVESYNKKKYSYTIQNLILKLYNIINLLKIFKEMIEKYDEIDFKILSKEFDYDELQYDLFSILNILQYELSHQKHTPRRQRKNNFIKLKNFYFDEKELEEFKEIKEEIKEEFKEQFKEELQQIKENMQQKFENKQEIKKEIKIDKNNINSIKISSDDKELFLYI